MLLRCFLGIFLNYSQVSFFLGEREVTYEKLLNFILCNMSNFPRVCLSILKFKEVFFNKSLIIINNKSNFRYRDYNLLSNSS